MRTFILPALALAASFVSAEAIKRHGDLIDVDALADIDILDQIAHHNHKRSPHGDLVDIDALADIDILNKAKNLHARGGDLIDIDTLADLDILNINKAHQGGRMSKKHKRDLVDIDISIEVNTLVANVISTLEPVLKTVTDTVGGAKELGEDAVAATLKTAFTTIDSALSELSGSLGGLAGGALKTKRAGHAKRALSDQEVATTLANLLNGVAGAVNLAEGLTTSLPILGPILGPIYDNINGSLSTILSNVGQLLVGVVSLVKGLLGGVVGTVAGLPILGSLLGGLLGGL